MQDLTGYVWSQAGIDLLTDDLYGVLTLAGGVDGKTSTAPATSPSATSLLVVDRYASAAALFAVEAEAARPGSERRLFPNVDLDDEGEATLDIGLTDLFVTVLGKRVSADGLEVAATADLWRAVNTMEGPRVAWAAVLSGLLRDPDFLLY
jgi:hypothetical protein